MNNCPKCGSLKLYYQTSRTHHACYDCEWEEDSERDERTFVTIIVVIFLMVGLASFWLGRQTITLSDLSQQRARDISHAVARQCDDKFVTPLEKAKAGEPAIRQAAARCSNVADLALEAVYAAGVEAEDRVMARAKELAKKAKVQ